MRASRVLNKLRANEVALCTKLNVADARVAQIAALSGFDCIWTDMEHVANDWSAVEKQILAAAVHGVDTIVRVSKGGYSDYVRPLELDAAGIMIPHVMNAEEAREIVRLTKFHPLGLRPADGGNADALFGMIPFQAYIREANEQRFVILQIEDPEALSTIDEMAALPGVDMLFFGPGDYSQAIGVPGEIHHPLVNEARQRVAEAAVRAGKYAGTLGRPDKIPGLIAMGYRFICTGADVFGLAKYYKDLLDQVQCNVALPTSNEPNDGAYT
ncbi:MAG: aldolase [Paenibacillus sp.]|jgi:4-hydroxy-2-oxoheptanedioate aldolase|nr:aldolase [Paenibacillus sp.]